MMEKHLLNVAAIAQKHHAVLEEQRRIREQEEEEERDLAAKKSIFIDKLKAIRQQIEDYRDSLIPILDQLAINIRMESWEDSAHILHVNNKYKTQVILAIAAKQSRMMQAWRCCGFFAILGDFAKDQIDIYEYSDEIKRNKHEYTILNRAKFEKHARHLVNMSIDHFEFDMVKHFITDYLAKELDYIKLEYPSPKLFLFKKSTLWKIKPKPTSNPEPSTNTKQPKNRSSSPIWMPISAGIKYLNKLFNRPKKQ